MTEKTQKFDFKKEFKVLFSPSAKTPEIVNVPAMKVIRIHGQGYPGTSQAFKDKIENSITFEYLWEIDLQKTRMFSKPKKKNIAIGSIKNTERVLVENIYTFTDREKSVSFSNIPVRVTAEHNSSYRLTENVEFGMNLKTMVGVEEKIIPPSVSGNKLPSMGFEIGIAAKIIF